MRRHNDFIPEAFTSDYQVHWGQHFLRPEFLESTYFLHRYRNKNLIFFFHFGTIYFFIIRATHDPHYLEVGRDALRAIQVIYYFFQKKIKRPVCQ